tara:strand:- start:1819 stop:2007 length:189 start_codon:yes stop_codon:yes gene_type:complete
VDNKDYIFQFRGKLYEVQPEEEENRREHIYTDFLYCLKIRDYLTLKNRIINGLKWKWLKEIK